MYVWQAQEAKAKFSQLLDECQKEPQLVTRHGEDVAYIISATEFHKIVDDKKREKKMTIGDFFRQSPLYGMGEDLNISRVASSEKHRDVFFNGEDDA